MEATLHSAHRQLCPVTFPEYRGRQRYMHSFDASEPTMPEDLIDYLDTARSLLRAAGRRSGMVHMTIDEKIVQPGMSQRRPGPHVDGCFMPAAKSWGHGGGWLHTCNDLRLGGPLRRMAVIVAASVPGCRVWPGEFRGQPASNGDLAHIAEQFGASEVLSANVGYLLSPDCVHESMIFDRPTQRQFLRIAFDAEQPQ